MKKQIDYPKNAIIIFLLIVVAILFAYKSQAQTEHSTVQMGITHDTQPLADVMVGGRLGNFEMGLNYRGNPNNRDYVFLGLLTAFYSQVYTNTFLVIEGHLGNLYTPQTGDTYLISLRSGISYQIKERWQINLRASMLRNVDGSSLSLSASYYF